MIDSLYQNGAALLGAFWPLVWSLLKIIAVILPLLGCVAFFFVGLLFRRLLF